MRHFRSTLLRTLAVGGAVVGLALVASGALEPRAGESREAALPGSMALFAQTPTSSAVTPFLAALRGISPLVCELALRSFDYGSRGWSHGGSDYGGDALLMGAASEEARRVLTEMRRPASPRDLAALRDGLGDGDVCVRRISARALARQGEEGVDILLAALAAGASPQREAAILGLGDAESRRSVAPLLGLLADPDPAIRSGAAWAIGHSRSPEAAAALTPLTRDAVPGVRAAAAHALGNLEATSEVPALAELIAADPDPAVRGAAAWALGQIP